MQLTKGQENALKVAIKRYKDKEPYTVIAGYAGTGKSTLVKYIIDALGFLEEDVVYIAYTGKASLVLKSKGCLNSMTAHRLLYNAIKQPDDSCIFEPKFHLDENYKMIVLDEASMIPKNMWDLLLSHGVYVLALGDNGQLPPIDGNSKILDNPNAVLTEIVRQALDSPIIRLSVDIRNGKYIELGGGKDCKIISSESVPDRLLMGADQIICGKNITRHELNDKIRMIKWKDKYTKSPMNGDKAVCLKNQWSKVNLNGEPLVNGMIGTLQNVSLKNTSKYYKPLMHSDFIVSEDSEYFNMRMDYKLFTEKKTTINKDNWNKFPKKDKPYEFDYAYAITAHKSQGSEYEKVIVYDEWLGDKEYHQKWLYTAVTRASKKLVIVE